MARIAPLSWERLDPRSRLLIEEGAATGMYPETTAMRVVAHSPEACQGMHEGYKAVFGTSALGMRLQELLRIRSAQLNGCDLCATAVKDESVASEDVVCLADPNAGSYSESERLALRFLETMILAPDEITDKTFRALAAHFTTRQIVELAWFCGTCLGTHRFMHALDMIGQGDPILGLEDVPAGTAA